jgi:MerR family transcriptional regulator, redox-sensitive transcriptional activator SoxR
MVQVKAMPRELTIGELSARSGVSQSALRFYERKGLISAERSHGNQRRYPRVTLRRVALVQAGKAAGIPLERIREALDTLPADRPPTKRDWERLSRRWRAELDERIATLEGIRGRLTGCIGCGCLSLRRCTLINPGDEAAASGAGAHYLVRAKGADAGGGREAA